jgi:hypothetical protein
MYLEGVTMLKPVQASTYTLAQIKQKEYFQKYWLSGRAITCVGANFDTATRTVSAWESEAILP